MFYVDQYFLDKLSTFFEVMLAIYLFHVMMHLVAVKYLSLFDDYVIVALFIFPNQSVLAQLAGYVITHLVISAISTALHIQPLSTKTFISQLLFYESLEA